MDELLRVGREAGLQADEVTGCLRLGRPLSETNWVLASEGGAKALEVAQEAFEAGRWIEYQCYDDAGHEQGRAEVELEKWEDTAEGLFTGRHGIASDQYYQWYVEHGAPHGFVFHICGGKATSCRKRLARGDRREVIHLDKWRMLTPQAMVETPYLRAHGKRLGRAEIEKLVQDKSAQRPPVGTGLDQAMEEARRAQQLAELEVAAKKAVDPPGVRRGRSRSPIRFRRLADKLEAQEKKRAADRESGAAGSGVSRKKEKSKKEKERRRRRRRSSSESSSKSSSGSASSLFRSASARGGDLWRLAQKKPGRLTEMSMREMARYLAGQSERGLDKGDALSLRVLSYLNQIVLNAHPPSKIGIRAHRELLTLATALDELLDSNNLRCLDILMQRFKAVEASLQDSGWNLARHYELIPPHGAQLSRESERELATKAEIRSMKLKEAAAKMNKTK